VQPRSNDGIVTGVYAVHERNLSSSHALRCLAESGADDTTEYSVDAACPRLPCGRTRPRRAGRSCSFRSACRSARTCACSGTGRAFGHEVSDLAGAPGEGYP